MAEYQHGLTQGQRNPTGTQVYETIADGSDEVDLNGRKVNTRAYCSWYNFKSTDQSKKARHT